MKIFEDLTQKFSTFGDKLLQHTDILYSIQNDKKFKPITIQLAPTEVCDLNCGYCSVANRDKTKKIDFETIKNGIDDFVSLGAKSIEITGGGNPLLYPQINELIKYSSVKGLKIGIITNSLSLDKLNNESLELCDWIRISLSKLDFINDISLIDIKSFDKKKLSFSYIVNEKTNDEILNTLLEINKKFNPKFIRIAPDCLKEDSIDIKERLKEFIDKIDGNIFIKEINDNFLPYDKGCYVGLIRPYWNHKGVFICTSHVLKNRKYEDEWKMCDVENIKEFYKSCNERLMNNESPYCVDVNKCYHCYYYNNNKLLHTVITKLEDKDFA